MSESPPLSPPPSPGGDHSGAAGDPSSRREPNPGAAPFVPHSDAGPSRLSFGSPEGLCFSISSDSDEDSEEDLHWIPPCSSPKGKKVACSSPKGNKVAADARPDPGGFMADARRAPRRRPPPPVGETDAQLHATPLVDAEGFQLVVNKHRLRSELRQPRRPPARRPVPADLIGRCFNCLASDHVASRCSFPSRCLRCEEVGHVAKNCKRPRPVRGLRGRGRPVRRVHSSDAAAATRSRGVGRSAASASTASSGSASTGRPYSRPPSICAASPIGRPRSPSPPPVPVLPRGHPSRRPSMVVRTIPARRNSKGRKMLLPRTPWSSWLWARGRPSPRTKFVDSSRIIMGSLGATSPFIAIGLKISLSSSATTTTCCVC